VSGERSRTIARRLLVGAILVVLGCARDSAIDGERPTAGRGAAAADGGASGRGEAGNAGTGTSGSDGAGTGEAGVGTAGRPSPPVFDANTIVMSSCYQRSAETEILPPNILFVIDRSGSMACNPPPITDSQTCETDFKRTATDQPTKWEITQQALVESLKALPETARVGVSYFSNDDSCGVHPSPSVPISRISPAQREVIEGSLRNVQPGGATPLVGATVLAYRHIHDLALAGRISGNKFVVLITDGKQSDSCSDPPRCASAEQCTELLVNGEVPRAAAMGVGIRTFVIGVPGSEQDQRTLSRIALAGMTARPGCEENRNCHFDLSGRGDFGAPLQEALINVLGQTRTCDIRTPPSPEGGLDLVNLLFRMHGNERRIIPQDTSAACDNGAQGWQPIDGGRIRLCGAYCELVKADPDIQLEFVIGCPVQGPQ